MVHLHVRSWFSFLAGGSSPQALVIRARHLGQKALALTDLHGVYGCVRFARACREAQIKAIFGATLVVAGYPLVLLAQNPRGYENLCNLISLAHRNYEQPPWSVEGEAFVQESKREFGKSPRYDGNTAGARSSGTSQTAFTKWPRFQGSAVGARSDRTSPEQPQLNSLEELTATDHLICLTGGSEGQLAAFLRSGKSSQARGWLRTLAAIFAGRLYVELAHWLQPQDGVLIYQMAQIAAEQSLPLVATNAVRYATPEDFPRYDALTCVRLGLTVGDRHPQRPVNDCAHLKSEADLRALILYPQAFANTERIADSCDMDLLPGEVTPPTALLPPDKDADTYLRELCDSGLRQRYPANQQPAAFRQLEHELEVVSGLDLCEFFLVVHEVVNFARSQGIRCAGRGSAANSIIAYCVGITTVDPLAHKLLFERFLHRGRKGMPDIDVDFDSERRPEVIAWMETRFGVQHTAMTANVNTYRLRGAVRELMKVLGWDLDTIGRVSRLLSHYECMTNLAERRAEFEAVLGTTPLLDVLFQLVAGLKGCPRHLSLHNGGMILSRAPLAQHSPVQTSANGVRQIQFDKDDAEDLGLIKLDVLGLRSLAVVSEALTLQLQDSGERIELDRVSMDDEATFQLIRRGATMSVFQIESPGQWNLLSRTQPRGFDDLVAEVALFRPGPLQGDMVNPYVERRAGRQPVTYPHPSMRTILQDTYGVILYQEQVLEVSHQFAGMSLEEADKFRSLMSKWRDPGDMENMREKFVSSAMKTHGVSLQLAEHVFSQVAAFVGYGFCRSHAAAFAQLVYHTAYLKAHYPAAYMAAVLQHKPGFYPMSTVIEEVKHLGVRILPVSAWKSMPRYSLENGAIRIPLTQVKGMSEELAAKFVRQRAGCETLEMLRRCVHLPGDVWDALARAGAFDQEIDRRDALWQLGLLRNAGEGNGEAQQHLLTDTLIDSELLPELDPLSDHGLVGWDFETTNVSPRQHPVELYRSVLQAQQVLPIESLYRIAAGKKVKVAGVVVTLQRPQTAKGMTFIVLEDESGRLPIAVTPPVFARKKQALRSAALIIYGKLEQAGANYRSLLVEDAWPLDVLVSEQQSVTSC